MNSEQIIVDGRTFKLRYSAPQYSLRLPWSMSCRVDGEGGDSAKRFFQEREGARLQVVFCVPALGLVHGSAFCQAQFVFVNCDVSLAFEGTSPLHELRDWPITAPPEQSIAAGVPAQVLEEAAREAVRNLTPATVHVEVRRTQRVRGVEPGTIIIEMSIGEEPW